MGLCALAAAGVWAAPAQAITFSQTTLPFNGLKFPSGVAVDRSGDVFVADENNNQVVELPVGSGEIALPFSGLASPFGVAVDGSGDVFVAEPFNGVVVELPAGGAQVTLPFTGLNNPVGVAVDRTGDVFVADGFNGRVVELLAGGGPVTLPFTGLGFASGVAVDGSGNLFVSDVLLNKQVVELSPSVPSGSLAVSPSAGPAGTTIAATSVSPCPTGGAFGSATAKVSLTSFTGAVLNAVTAPLDAAGNWTTLLTVPRGAGPDFFGAKCLTANGLVTQIYASVTFTVTPGLACNLVFNQCIVAITLGRPGTLSISSRLLQALQVGILVQRIKGKRRLVTVGRVPFGHHPKGRLTLRWDLRVNGRRLPKGRYLITLRALHGKRTVIAVTAPIEINIDRKGRATVPRTGIKSTVIRAPTRPPP